MNQSSSFNANPVVYQVETATTRATFQINYANFYA